MVVATGVVVVGSRGRCGTRIQLEFVMWLIKVTRGTRLQRIATASVFFYLKKNNTPNSGPLHGHLLVAVAAQIATPYTVTSRTGKVHACGVQ